MADILWMINLFSLSTGFGALIVLGLLLARLRKTGVLFLFLVLALITFGYGSGFFTLYRRGGFFLPSIDLYTLIPRAASPSNMIHALSDLILIVLAPLIPQTFFHRRENWIWLLLSPFLLTGFILPLILAWLPPVREGWMAVMGIARMGGYEISLLYAMISPLRWRKKLPPWIRRPLTPVLAYFAFFHFPAMAVEDILMLTRRIPVYNLIEATGYLGLTTATIVFTLLYLLHGGTAPLPAESIEALSRRYGLTPREEEVLRHLVEGAAYKEIAAEFSISLDTVKTHTSRIYRKTGTPGKQALRYFVRDFTA